MVRKDHSPLTTHHSPLTTHNKKPLTKETVAMVDALIIGAGPNGLVAGAPDRSAPRTGGTRAVLTLAKAPSLDLSKRLA